MSLESAGYWSTGRLLSPEPCVVAFWLDQGLEQKGWLCTADFVNTPILAGQFHALHDPGSYSL